VGLHLAQYLYTVGASGMFIVADVIENKGNYGEIFRRLNKQDFVNDWILNEGKCFY
jgi:hypothetical protein